MLFHFLYQGFDIPGVDDQHIDRTIAKQGQTIHCKGKNVVKREWTKDDFLSLFQNGLHDRADLQHIGDEIAIGQHGALGYPGGTARILKDDDIFGIVGDRWQTKTFT